MTRWKLKVLSGSHAGAEMATEQTNIVLGSDSARADCVLSDCDFAAVACQLTLTDTDQVIKILSDQVWYLNGKRQSAGIARIKPYQVIQVGGVAFAFGPSDVVWPVLTVPVVSRRRIPWAGIALSGVLVVGSLSASLVVSTKYAKTRRTTAAQLLEQLDYSSVTLQPLNDRLLLSGYVEDRESLQALKNTLAESQQPIEWQVYRVDSVQNAVTTWLAQHDLAGLDVTVDTQGVAHIKGVMKDGLELAEISNSLQDDVQGLTRTDWQTARISGLIGWLQQAIRQQNLPGLMVAESDEHIYLTGKLAEQEKPKLTALLERAAEQFGHQVPVKYQAFLLPDSPLPSIRAVSLSRTPYVVMSDGQKYLTSAVIGDGYTIREITDEGIAIAKQGKQWWLPTGG